MRPFSSFPRAAFLALGFALGLGLTAPSVASAGTIDDAKRWFQEGDDAETAGDCKTAIEKFELALQVKETPQLYLRIGRCQDKLGTLVDARGSYEKARALSVGNEQVSEVVDEQLKALEPRIPRVKLVLKTPHRDQVVIEVNGNVVAGGDQRVDPGEVSISARAPGYQPFEMRLRLQPGDQRTIPIDLSPAKPENKKPAAPVEDPSSGPSPASYVLFGVGAVGIGVGIGVLARGFSLQGDLEDPKQFGCTLDPSSEYVCTHPSFGGDDAKAVQSRSNTFKAAGGATLGVGAAAAVTGLIVLIATRHDAKPPPVTFEPAVGPRTGMLTVSRSF